MGVLDALIYGVRDVFNAVGEKMPRRSRIKFTSGVTDDPLHDMIVVDTATISLDAGGNPYEVQWNNAGALDGTPNLTIDATTGDIVHDGIPVHNEDYGLFKRSTGGFARPQWEDVITTNATATTLVTLSFPYSVWGNGYLTLIAECSIAYASGGGNRCLKAVYKRTSGTLAKVNEVDNSNSSDWTGTAVGGFTTDNPDNDTIRLRGTGISSTSVQWLPNIHAIFAKIPA